MTTIIGIKGYDSNRKKDYVLLASDSQGIFLDEKSNIIGCDYNTTKIICNFQKRFILANAGYAIYPPIYNPNENSFKEIINLAQNNKTKEELISSLKEIQKQYGENVYVGGSNFGGKVSIWNFEKRTSNNFSDYAEDCFGVTCEGSGSSYASGKIGKSRKWDFKTTIPLDEAIFLCLDGLKEATKKDKFTGGHMDLAVITNTNSCSYSNFAELNKNEQFSKLIKKSEEELKKYPYYPSGKFIDILLN